MPVFQFRWLWKNMTKRDHVLFILGLFISVVSTVMLLINPYLSSILVDEVIVGGVRSIRAGQFTGETGGKVLRK